MYYLCKLSESWSLVDKDKGSSRILDKNEIDVLKRMFPIFFEDDKFLTYVEVSSIHPNKLMKLHASQDKKKWGQNSHFYQFSFSSSLAAG